MKKLYFFFIFLILLSLLLSPLKIFAETDESIEEKEFDISTSPHNIFFNISNLKPGDRITKIISIKNDGKKDFEYIFTNRFLTGSKHFYDELLLTVKDGSKILYDGHLSKFDKLDSRSLKTGFSEELVFIVEIPYELGNEFQGLSSEFQFKLYVEGTLGGVLPVDNKLPNTATEIFNLIFIGAGMVTIGSLLFFYQKRKKRDDKTKTFKEKVIGP